MRLINKHHDYGSKRILCHTLQLFDINRQNISSDSFTQSLRLGKPLNASIMHFPMPQFICSNSDELLDILSGNINEQFPTSANCCDRSTVYVT